MLGAVPQPLLESSCAAQTAPTHVKEAVKRVHHGRGFSACCADLP